MTAAGYQTLAERNLTCAMRIRERRLQLGLTQAQVAALLASQGTPLSNQVLSAIENGRGLAVGRLPGLAAVLDCTVTYLIGLTADPRRWEPDRPVQLGNQAAERPVSSPPPSPVPPPGGAAAASGGQRRIWILGPDPPPDPGIRLARWAQDPTQ
jgi:transcriptional regulator with XRE-family HTH domain